MQGGGGTSAGGARTSVYEPSLRAWYQYGVRGVVASILLGLASSSVTACTLPFDPQLLEARDGGACGSVVCGDCQRCEGDRCVEGAVGQECGTGRCARPLSGERLTCCAGCISGDRCATGASDAACGSGGEACAACDGTILRCVDASCRVSRPVAEVSLDTFHTCAFATTGEARCWGQPKAGSLDGMPLGPDDIELAGAFRSITAFGGYDAAACGVALDGTLSCWGSNVDSQVGVGSAAGMGNQPRTALAAGTTLTAVEGGAHYACALASSGAVYCWGNGDRGHLGLGGAFPDRPERTLTGCARWRSLSLFYEHACAICEADGIVYCWGDNSSLAAGRADPAPVETPEGVANTVGFDVVRVGRRASCGLLGGRVLCWGTALSGDIVPGDPTFASHQPTDVFPGETGFTDVSVGGTGGSGSCPAEAGVTCAIREGALYCWGSNCWGELGQGDEAPRTTRVRVNAGDTDENDWTRVFAGEASVCALKESGALYCWGDNSVRQIVSSRVNRVVPDDVPRPTFIPLD